MRFIVKTCPQRSGYIPYLKERIPNLEVVLDPGGGVMDCFQESLRVAGDDAVVHLEDDIVLTSNFCEKALAVIADFPYVLIQFFSMRKKDLEIGSRWESGRTFLMNQCVYYPEGCPETCWTIVKHGLRQGMGRLQLMTWLLFIYETEEWIIIFMYPPWLIIVLANLSAIQGDLPEDNL